MKSILEINESLDSMRTYLFKNRVANDAIILLQKRLYSLNKSEEENLLKNFERELFPKILENITHTFNFYDRHNVYLPIKFKQDLILKYILEFDQIVSASEDLFISSFPQTFTTRNRA